MRHRSITTAVLLLLLAATGCASTKTVHTTTTVTARTTVTSTPVRVVATRTATETVTYTPDPVDVVSDGTYVVGSDIPAGIYRTDGLSDNGDKCYWARLSSLSTDDIIDNDNFTGQTTIQVKPSDKALELSGGCTWSRVD